MSRRHDSSSKVRILKTARSKIKQSGDIFFVTSGWDLWLYNCVKPQHLSLHDSTDAVLLTYPKLCYVGWKMIYCQSRVLIKTSMTFVTEVVTNVFANTHSILYQNQWNHRANQEHKWIMHKNIENEQVLKCPSKVHRVVSGFRSLNFAQRRVHTVAITFANTCMQARPSADYVIRHTKKLVYMIGTTDAAKYIIWLLRL